MMLPLAGKSLLLIMTAPVLTGGAVCFLALSSRERNDLKSKGVDDVKCGPMERAQNLDLASPSEFGASAADNTKC